MIYKYYTADCVDPTSGITSGNGITRVYLWQSPRFALDKLYLVANEKNVKLSNFRRVK